MTLPRFSKSAASLFLLLALSSTLAFAGPIIGSSNTATADPPVQHPNTKPCKVVLFDHYKFANFNAQSFSYAPPANCAAPWGKVILVADFSVSKGIQYDRTANIWIGPTNIYFGTTSEPDPNDSRHWQIQRDLTDYSSIFTTSQTGTVDLGNLVNKTYTGILYGTRHSLFLSGRERPVRARYRRPGHRLLCRIHRRHRRSRQFHQPARGNSNSPHQHRAHLFRCLRAKPEQR